MSTKTGIYLSSTEEWYLYWETYDEELHLQYQKKDDNIFLDLVIPKDIFKFMSEAFLAELGVKFARSQSPST